VRPERARGNQAIDRADRSKGAAGRRRQIVRSRETARVPDANSFVENPLISGDIEAPRAISIRRDHPDVSPDFSQAAAEIRGAERRAAFVIGGEKSVAEDDELQ
jgi:hypothetical protein